MVARLLWEQNVAGSNPVVPTMNAFLYSLLALAATVLGSISGMGGGVIMKPVMDFMGRYDSPTIGVLSSLTVFSMSLVSLLKSVRTVRSQNKNMPFAKLVILSLGSVAGGTAGQIVYELLCNAVQNNGVITVVQNVLLLALIGAVFFYMVQNGRIRNYRFSSAFVFASAGIVLGLLSSFLGIGGGPINVALLMYLFSFEIKTATFASLMTIFFAQIAKLTAILFGTGFAAYNLEMAPFMIICAIAGGFIGTHIKKTVSSKTVGILFNCMQLLIMLICILNIVKAV